MNNPIYIAIDLKSFYASVECVERKLDPLTTNLVVADASRTEKTICLAVSPSLKAHGIPGRARLFEVIQKVKEANAKRKYAAPHHVLCGAAFDDIELKNSPALAIDYIIASPRMALYMEYSTRIYQIYLKYIAPEDIHIYSIDEVFMDVTPYLDTYKTSPKELSMKIILDVLHATGITATAGIGTNLYLCKIAMDVQAKHVNADENGVRIAALDEMSYRRNLWTHRPLTDFWRVGKGYMKKLEEHGLFTMGDIARCSLGQRGQYHNEELLYKLFGVNAELLIDHAWGYEPCTIADIKAYKPSTNSLGSGQVLQSPYPFAKAKLVIQEMTELLVLDLVDKGLVTDQLVLTVGYDIENLKNSKPSCIYKGEITTDHYGRKIPKHAHGTANLDSPTSSTKLIVAAVMKLCNEIMNPDLFVRRINITANHIVDEHTVSAVPEKDQLDLFTDYEALERQRQKEDTALKRERQQQLAMLAIKKKYGKNAILKARDLQDGATIIARNKQIGGHKA
jgi:DNA polymerase V